MAFDPSLQNLKRKTLNKYLYYNFLSHRFYCSYIDQLSLNEMKKKKLFIYAQKAKICLYEKRRKKAQKR